MEEYKLKDNDLELLCKIEKVNIAIEKLYKKLYCYEIEYHKDDSEYRKLIDYIKMLNEYEDRLYKELELDYSKCCSLINYILINNYEQRFLNNYDDIIEQDYSNRVNRRILSVLMNEYVFDDKNIHDILSDDLVNLGLEYNIDVYDNLGGIYLQKAFRNDMLNGVLSILQSYIESNNYSSLRNDLIKFKYNISFVNRNIEKDMINNCFSVDKDLCLSSRIVADITNTDLELYKLMLSIYGINESGIHIIKLINIKDIDYRDNDMIVNSILRQCFIRALLLTLDEENINNINYEFHEVYDNSNNNISREIIINCFKNIKRDKNKIKILSLGYRKDM